MELGGLGASEGSCALLLSATEGEFERRKALMGGCQLPQWGQLRVGETHNHFRDPLGGAQEQGPPFAAERAAFWIWPWRPRYLITSLFWAGRRACGRACYERFCKLQTDRRH